MIHFLVFLVVFSTFSTGEFRGQPICNDLPTGTRVADSFNCSRFYTCVYGKAVLQDCPIGTWFGTNFKECKFIGNFSEERKAECNRVSSTEEAKENILRKSSHKSKQKVNVSWIFDNFLKSSTNGLPGKISLDVPIRNYVAKLMLVKRENFTKSIKVVTSLRGKPEEWQPDESEEWGVYSDPKSLASMSVVRKLINGSKTVLYDGIFTFNDTRYQLRVDDAGIKSYPVDEASAKQVTINGTDYLLSQDIVNTNLVDNTGVRVDNGKSMMTKLERLISAEQQKHSAKKNCGIELLIVLDYSVYYKWYVRSKGTDEKSKIADAISNIRYFYTHIVNGINDRYMNIVDDDFSFYVKVVGYSIAQAPEDSPFTEKINIKIEGQYAIVADLALDEFEKWVKSNASRPESQLPKFDSAALFTDYEMKAYDRMRTITGLANIGVICTSRSLSVNKDYGQYATIETAAHEIGHNLGAYHDGDGNSCSSQQQYIMAHSPGELFNSTFYNPYHFSSCSINYFKKQIQKLDSEKNNCLLNAASNNDPSFDDNLRTLPGQLYDIDLQCRMLFGNSSYYCAGGGERDALICKELSCWNPKTSQCLSKVEQRALEGTKCGEGAWCIRGSCAPDPKAPKTPAACIYGDFKAPFILGDQAVDCLRMSKNRPDRCYEKYYNDLCCTSCSAVADLNKPGCEWGDKLKGPQCSNLKPADCYESYWRKMCCAKCKQFELNLPAAPNCTFGDMMDCSHFTRSMCYGNEELCCKTCASLKTSLTGCEYGDLAPNCEMAHCRESMYWSQCCYTCRDSIAKAKNPNTSKSASQSSSCPSGDMASWCSSITGPNCYGANKTCCNSCQKFYVTDNIGCEYGDRASWCSSKVQSAGDCQNPDVALICCHSCRVYKIAISAAPSCPNGDQSGYCERMKSWECYNFKDTCCETCSRYYNSSARNCEYGNKVDWCESYIRGPEDCVTAEVADSCCRTCSKMFSKTAPLQMCKDESEWCSVMFNGFCYDPKIRIKCCSTCEAIMQKRPKHCPYGDRYNWCSGKYCSMNSVECCGTCG